MRYVCKIPKKYVWVLILSLQILVKAAILIMDFQTAPMVRNLLNLR